MKKLFRALYKIHRYLGLFLALHLFILAITGALLLWREEIETLILVKDEGGGKAGETFGDHDELITLKKIEELVKVQFPQKKILSFFRDEDHEQMVHVRLAQGNSQKFRGAMKLQFNAQGARVESAKIQSRFFDWLLKLHREFLLGGKGKIYVGLIGVVYLITLCSGWAIYPFFSKTKETLSLEKPLKNSRIQNKQNSRLRLSEAHKFFGLSSLGWALIVGLTGVMLSYNSLLISLFLQKDLQQNHFPIKQSREASSNLSGKNYLSVLSITRNLKEVMPDYRYDFISFPDNEFSLPSTFVVLMEGIAENNQGTKKIAFVNGMSGELQKIQDLPWYLNFLILSEPLHFGNYGGIPLKLSWTLMSLFTLFLPLSGVMIFGLRKRLLKGKSLSFVELFLGTFLRRISLPKVFIVRKKLRSGTMVFLPIFLIVLSFILEERGRSLAALAFLFFGILVILNFYQKGRKT